MVLRGADELFATAAASFLLGWTLKNSNIATRLLNFRVPTITKTKMVIVVRPDIVMSKGEI